MRKKKILIGYNFILHYRIPLFNLLSKNYDVTVLHSGNTEITDTDIYKEVKVPVKKIGPVYFQPGLLKEIRKDYDIIILLFDVRWIHTIISTFLYNKKSKLILWGAWITQNKLANTVRLFLTKRADASIFYTETARQDFVNKGVSSNMLFVANNTFDVGERVKCFEHPNKFRILFVGSLHVRKQNDILLKAFANIKDKIPGHINLSIIGGGIDKENLVNIAQNYKIEDRVVFLGHINEPGKLKKFYKEAIVNVSFGQAGLSVLQSLGFGVPFLTKRNAISGGEISNIKNGFNGILCDNDIMSLQEHLLSLCLDIEKSREMGLNAYDYYDEFCTIENMAQGFIDAIENTKLAKIDINI